MASHAKVLILGLDAAELSRVKQWAAEGHLPHLQRLMDQGAMTPLRSSAAEFPDEVWPSIYTSNNSAQIGKYYYIQPDQTGKGLQLVDDHLKRGKTFWQFASDYNKRSAVVDLPKIALTPGFHGVQVANWGAHATRCETASQPPELIEEILERFGPYPLHSCDDHGTSPEDYRALRDRLIAGVRLRTRVFEELLAKRGPWDLFFAVFAETHCAGHQLWHLQDPGHPSYGRAGADGLQTAMRDVYQAVDEGLGKLIEANGPDAFTLVFAGHGMQPQYHGRDLIPDLLRLWGLYGPENIEPDQSREKRVTVQKSLLRKIKAAVPISVQYAVKRILPRPIENALVCRLMGTEKLDHEARAFYVPNNDLTAAIRINVKGRDPKGLVEPGEEYEKLLDWLTVRFQELINPATGKPAAVKISRIKEIYSGPYVDVLPDLTAMWSPEAPIESLYSPGYGTVAGRHDDVRTGGHGTDGFLIAGPHPNLETRFDAPSSIDLGPTVLSLLEVPQPEEFLGKPLLAPASAGTPKPA